MSSLPHGFHEPSDHWDSYVYHTILNHFALINQPFVSRLPTAHFPHSSAGFHIGNTVPILDRFPLAGFHVHAFPDPLPCFPMIFDPVVRFPLAHRPFYFLRISYASFLIPPPPGHSLDYVDYPILLTLFGWLLGGFSVLKSRVLVCY